MLDLFQVIRRDGESAARIVGNASNIDVENDEGQNLLHIAIAYQNQSVIGLLITMGVDVNAQDSNGETPLHYAASYNNLYAADQILLNNGNLSLTDRYGNTPLWTSAFSARGSYDVVDLFLRHGARRLADIKNTQGKSPMDFARQIGDDTLLGMLTG